MPQFDYAGSIPDRPPAVHADEDSDDDSEDEGSRALTAYFRREVREHRAAREETWAGQAGQARQSGPALNKTFRAPSVYGEGAADTEIAVGQGPLGVEVIGSLVGTPVANKPPPPKKTSLKLYQDDDIEEKIDFDNNTGPPDRWVLRPDKPLRRTWDIYMLFLLLYVSTVSVFVFSFLGVLTVRNFVFWIERMVDMSFFIDICLNFFTAYENLGVLITDRRMIFKRYLFSWFIPDLVSTFPWDIVGGALNPGHRGPSIWQVPRYLRLLRIFKMIRLARILRLKRIVTYFEIRFRLKYAYVRAVTLVIVVALISHWCACLFYYFGAVNDAKANWSLEPGIPLDLYGRYIAALYFSVYTITTIGYGDVTPTNNVERTYTTIIMFFGAACFAFIISQVSNLAQELSSSSEVHRKRMDTLMDLASYRKLDTELVFQIRRYFQRDFLRQRVANENSILAAMSPDLRINVLKAIYSEKVDKSRLLKDIPKNDLDEVYGQMQGVFVRPNESVYCMHDKSDCMYIILKGEVVVDDLRDGMGTVKHCGDVFGENELLFDQRRRGRARCKRYCELVKVPREAVMGVLERHRRLLRELRKREALQLWAEAISTAEQQVRYWKMAAELKSRALDRITEGGKGPVLRSRLRGIAERSGWEFESIFLLPTDGDDGGPTSMAFSVAEMQGSEAMSGAQTNAVTGEVPGASLENILAVLTELSGRMADMERSIEALRREQ